MRETLIVYAGVLHGDRAVAGEANRVIGHLIMGELYSAPRVPADLSLSGPTRSRRAVRLDSMRQGRRRFDHLLGRCHSA